MTATEIATHVGFVILALATIVAVIAGVKKIIKTDKKIGSVHSAELNNIREEFKDLIALQRETIDHNNRMLLNRMRSFNKRLEKIEKTCVTRCLTDDSDNPPEDSDA